MTITVRTGDRIPFRVRGLPWEVVIELCAILPPECQVAIGPDWLEEQHARYRSYQAQKVAVLAESGVSTIGFLCWFVVVVVGELLVFGAIAGSESWRAVLRLP